MRVVSLTCSNTEIVCALKRGDWLVGVDDHSDYPMSVIQHLPRVGPDLGIDIERVRDLRPDLVLASLTVPGHEKIVAALEQAQLPYLAPEPRSLNDIYSDIQLISEHLDCPSTGRALVDDMRSRIGSQQPTTPAAFKPSVLVQWWPKPVIAPGRDSWVNALFDAVGLHNPLDTLDVKSTPLEDAAICDMNPDAVVISWCGVKTDKYRPEVVYRNPLWQDLDFVKHRRVFCVPEAHLGRPSPRLLDGYNDLHNIARHLRSPEL